MIIIMHLSEYFEQKLRSTTIPNFNLQLHDKYDSLMLKTSSHTHRCYTTSTFFCTYVTILMHITQVSCTCSVGFCPRARIAIPSSLLEMVPLLSLSNITNASLN